MDKTKTQKYNDALESITAPEIERLKKREEIAKNILSKMNEKMDIDTCGMKEWSIINLIGREIDILVN